MSKNATLLLITVSVLSSLIMVGSAFAQSAPKPSVPEFTVKFVNASYTVTTTNSYTGLDETEQICSNSIEITINNQPFDSSDYQIYYNIRVKPHFEDDWTEVYPLENRTSSYDGDVTFSYAQYINADSTPQSKSSYTIITFSVVPTDLHSATGYDIQRYYSGLEGQEGSVSAFLSAIPDGDKVDFQVQALVGHDSQVWIIEHLIIDDPLHPTIGGHFAPAVAYDGASDWSNTQTITIGESQTPSPEPTPTSTPERTLISDPNFSFYTGLALLTIVVAVFAGLLFYFKKRKH